MSNVIAPFKLTKDLHDRLYKLAGKMRRTVVSLIREAIEDLVEKYEVKK